MPLFGWVLGQFFIWAFVSWVGRHFLARRGLKPERAHWDDWGHILLKEETGPGAINEGGEQEKPPKRSRSAPGHVNDSASADTSTLTTPATKSKCTTFQGRKNGGIVVIIEQASVIYIAKEEALISLAFLLGVIASMASSLPHELIECILENLHHEKSTLINCALIGKAWALSAQRGIFQHIVLQLPNQHHEDFEELATAYTARNEQLLELFNRNPYLTSCVRTLELKQFSHGSRRASHSSNRMTYASTTRVVEQLSNVKKLTLARCDWETFTPELKTAVTDVFKTSSLTAVSLSHFSITSFNQLASLLSQSSCLSVLKIDFLHCHNGDAPAPIANCPPRSIQLDQRLHFRFVNMRTFVTWFQQDTCPLEIRNLQTLHIHIRHTTAPDYEDTAFLLQYIGSNLQELELQVPPWNPHSTLVHLGYTPNLRSVTLLRIQQTELHSPVPWILYLFKSIENSDDCKSILLRHLTIQLDVEYSDEVMIHRWDKWGAVDTLLARPTFASLQTVKFELLGVSSLASSGVETILSINLPFLQSSNKLQVQIPGAGEADIKSIKAVTSRF
ncbi:hypothetical protein F5876DRAFT_74299 [Lentinula aff. lateritia]|uniref:Uncharacterized protein n=1 Tax=Lentinula aff. lateritia TaxID=2804960 RepID=A0ACC1U7S9_9AGAR|nr:hypothetical protein F5876DRAFT_74299 [Lentinula aff. lateritia]